MSQQNEPFFPPLPPALSLSLFQQHQYKPPSSSIASSQGGLQAALAIANVESHDAHSLPKSAAD